MNTVPMRRSLEHSDFGSHFTRGNYLKYIQALRNYRKRGISRVILLRANNIVLIVKIVDKACYKIKTYLEWLLQLNNVALIASIPLTILSAVFCIHQPYKFLNNLENVILIKY